MVISRALEYSLNNETFAEGPNRYIPRPPINYEDNTVFSRFFEVVLPYDGECFIPVLGLSNTLRYIRSWLDSVNPTQPVKLSYPLYVGKSETKRTANSIIQSINHCESNLRLTNVETSKGLNYYGGQGLIFNEHWVPFMLCGFIMNIDRTSRTIHIIKPVCYISPVVFESNDLLSKAIIKKVIPYLSIHGVLAPTIFRNYSVLYNYDSFWHVPISIKYINDYFICPVEPNIIESLDDSIWSFLRENVNDLV